MPLLLAIETSQHRGSVAVRLSDGRIDSEPLSQKKRHDDDLLPAIDRLFSRNNLTPRDLASPSHPNTGSPSHSGGAVAVSIGPGGFTGLRIAVATAKMFAETLGTKIIAVPSALVAAHGIFQSGQRLSTDGADDTEKEENSRHEVPGRPPSALSATSADCLPSTNTGNILIALSAKNNTFWLTRVERIDNHWQISAAHQPGIADAQSMNLANISAVLADEHFPAEARARCERENIPVIAPVFDAVNCLAVAQPLFARGEFSDPLALLPLYPRQPEAVTIWQQKKRG